MNHEAEIMGHRLVFRTWNYGMKQKALRRSTKWARAPSGDLEPDVDPWVLNDMMLVQTLVEWDMEDGEGNPLPITLEAIHALEPPELVEEMIAYTQRINGVTVEELRKGDLILVRWLDASEIRCSVDEHEGGPEVYCKDWGVYLGVSGRKRRLLIVGKDVVEVQNDWGAARIPLELVDEILLVMPRKEALKAISEIQALGRWVRLRKWRKGEIERVRVV